MYKVLPVLLSIWLVEASQDISLRLPQHPSFFQRKSAGRENSLGFASPCLFPKLAGSEIGTSAFSPSAHPTKILSPTIPLRQTQRARTVMQLDPGTASFLCGSIAGVTSSFMVFPVDTAKTKMQTASSEDDKEKYSSVSKSISEVFQESGFAGLFRGCGPALLGSAPEAAIQMTAHDTTYGMLASMPHAPSIFVIQAIAGAAAGFFTILATNPLEVLKIRGQVSENSEKGSESKDGLVETLQILGLGGLFKGSLATWMRDIPFYAAYFPLYELGKEMVSQPLLAGLMAGVLATMLTLPADLIKTRIQAENLETDDETRSRSSWGGAGQLYPSKARRADRAAMIMAYSDMAGQQWQTLEQHIRTGSSETRTALSQWVEEGKKLVAERGLAGLYSGGSAGVMRKGAAMAISLSVYETLHDLAQAPLLLSQAAMTSGAQVAQEAAEIVQGVEGVVESMAALEVEVPAVIEAVGAVGQAGLAAAALL